MDKELFKRILSSIVLIPIVIFFIVKGSLLFNLFIMIICIATDIGGYVFGKIVKGPKLTKISPNKTYAGVIGGFILSIVSSFFLLNNINLNTQIDVNLDIFLFVCLISSINQAGDILISYFKRLSKIKDTGKIIPGHGGLLDRVDGMIFAFPFAYFIILINVFDIS